MSTEAPEILLAHYLKTLKLPTFQREYQKLAKDNGIQQRDVESMAGKKAIERTAPGQYIMLNGVWMKK